MIARGSDAPEFQDQTVRVILANWSSANSSALAGEEEIMRRFMQAYAETIDWMYASGAALRMYAAAAKISFDVAKRSRDEFYPKNNLRPNRLSGVDQAVATAVATKFLAAPLSKAQIEQFFQYQLPPVP